MQARLSVDRLTKLLLLFWVVAALALQVWLLHYSWRQLPLYTVLIAAVMAAASSLDRRSVAVVLGVAYVFPVITRYVRGLHSPFFIVLWLAAVVGVMLPDLLRASWHLPRRWRIPLVYSALATAVSAVVVLVREIDGAPLLMFDIGVAFWSGGTPPPFTLVWVLHVSITLVVGILWFDWLFGANDLDYERTIVTPLVAGALVLGLTALYQFFIDSSLLNETVFRVLGRATGTMWDANVAGMIAALWIGGAWLWAERLGGWRRVIAAPAVVVLAIALWATGSRTALLAGAIGLAGIATTLLFQGKRLERRRVVLAVGVFVLLAAAVVSFGRFSSRTNNAVVRMADMFEKHSSIGGLAREVWARNGYGDAAVEMIRQSPVAGVGIGAYHGLAYEFGLHVGHRLPPDNAQNWLRHQIAELGVVGGAGWVVWFFAFAFAVCVPRRDEPSSIWMARAAIVAFGTTSLLGMPGQDPTVALTFWVFACWYLRLKEVPPDARQTGWGTAATGATLLAVFTAASVAMAYGPLRLPHRAFREQQPLSYGYGPEVTAGTDAGFRSLNTRAVAIQTWRDRWLLVHIRSPKAGAPPMDVRVWVNNYAVFKARLTAETPFVGAVDLGGVPHPLLIETSAVREGRWRWWPFPETTDLLFKWEFVGDVPPRFKGFRSATDGGPG